MTFVETIEKIKYFIDSLEGREYLQQSRDVFIKVVYSIERQFLLMEKTDEKLKIEREQIDDVYMTIEHIQMMYINCPISLMLYDFAKSYLILIENWNNNTVCEDMIKFKIKFISDLYDNHMTVVDSINILKALLKRCERLLGFSLPSIELSKHFLESLDRENEKQ